MVTLTRLNHQEITVNAAHIVMIEETPDTVLTLYSGEKLMVRERRHEVVERVSEFFKTIGWVVMPLRVVKNAADELGG